jgi:demethylmenaquinone methyltransferase/2-methoxy-6-polyprenyl-1,4-benzoquinol methylase
MSTPSSTRPSLQETYDIQRLFNRIAHTYDLLNDCISFGIHRLWKQAACKHLGLSQGGKVLDVCTGTGGLIPLLQKEVGVQGVVTGLDFSEGMLEIAKQRFVKQGNVVLIQGDAMALPFTDASFDAAIISFGLRNVKQRLRAIQEMARVVKKGGRIICLDTCATPKLPFFWLYFEKFMPWWGSLIAQDKIAYDYLSQSTKHFLTPDELGALFKEAGLQEVTIETPWLGACVEVLGIK